MFGRREWNETCEMATEMICDAALKANAVLEVNLGGIKYGKRTLGRETRLPYPYRRFWEIVERKGNSVIYGLDVHAPQQYLQEDNFAIVDAVIQGLSLHISCKKQKETGRPSGRPVVMEADAASGHKMSRSRIIFDRFMV